MSNKVAKLSEKEKEKQELENFMKGRPNREEVANYVNSLMEQKYMPEILGSLQIGLMTIQAILIKKGICTGEEIQEITQQFLKQQQEDRKKAEQEASQKSE